LKYLVNKKIDTVDGVGRIMAEYYTDKDNLMKFVNKNERIFEINFFLRFFVWKSYIVACKKNPGLKTKLIQAGIQDDA
jgi:hypothetical protein